MSSKFYMNLIDYLADNEENNIFGVITIPEDSLLEEGLLVHGKYLGMVFTIYWKDQKSLQDKTMEELKGYANLTIEKLIDLYDLMEFFF